MRTCETLHMSLLGAPRHGRTWPPHSVAVLEPCRTLRTGPLAAALLRRRGAAVQLGGAPAEVSQLGQGPRSLRLKIHEHRLQLRYACRLLLHV